MKTLIKISLLKNVKRLHLINEYHLVTVSPWPLLIRIIVINRIICIIINFASYSNMYYIYIIVFISSITAFCWWRDINREASLTGDHSILVYNYILFGMILFIVREVFFFIRFFWRFFFYFKGGDVFIIIDVWPPNSIELFHPGFIPLLNSLLLLTSGCTLTIRHYILLNMELNKSEIWLILTLFLGLIFTCVQLKEYTEASTTIIDSSFGSIFFTGTGFHGLHVLVGSLFLLYTLVRIHISILRSEEHRGFNNRAWYWHFVDVVWLLLYTVFYVIIY